MTGDRVRVAGLVAVLSAGGLALGTGCQPNCCTVDSLPIPVDRAPLGPVAGAGAILALARHPDTGMTFSMAIDTASPLTILHEAQSSTTPVTRSFDLLDAADATPRTRARFRDVGVFALPVGPAGVSTTVPDGVLGGDLLRTFSMEFRFGAFCAGAAAGVTARCSSLTFWRHQGATSGFLGSADYATLRFTPFGGGETTARAQADWLGIRAPITLPATRVVLRACAMPAPFAVTDDVQTCCHRGDEVANAKGVDVSLVLATGTGPLVLSTSAWNRILPQLPAAPTMTPGSLLIPSWPLAIDANWTAIPRLALVDLEAAANSDQGPCVDLARARRIRWVANQQSQGTPTASCVQFCDTDPAEPSLAQNSAAYVELGGSIPVAVIKDEEELLQSLRFDVRPEGPEVDGLLGAGALGPTRLEVDYLSKPARAIFSCEPGTAEDVCFATSRCPRLPDHSQKHTCFGLPTHGLPQTCGPSMCP